MLKLIGRYFNACSQIAWEHSAARALELRSAAIRRQEEDLRNQGAAKPVDDTAELVSLRAGFSEQFQAAVIDTAIEFAKIKSPALQAIAQRVALARYLANALPEQKYLVHQVFGSSRPPLTQ